MRTSNQDATDCTVHRSFIVSLPYKYRERERERATQKYQPLFLVLLSAFFQKKLFPGGLTNPAYIHDDDNDDDDDDDTPVEPTLAETVLPWMRQSEEDVCQAPLKQREFPAWLKNEDYMPHGSPTSEMLGLDSSKCMIVFPAKLGPLASVIKIKVKINPY